MNNFIATKNDEGRTLLKYLEKTLIGVPKSKIERIFRNKDIVLNGKRVTDKKIIINEGDALTIYGVRFSDTGRVKVPINFDVIFEDDNILVINKPINIDVHGSTNSLDNQVLSYLKFVKKDSFTPSHVGRLDKVTSGIMIYGKNYHSLRELKEKQKYFTKIYLAKTQLKKNIYFTGMIMHDEQNHKETISENEGKHVEADFKLLENHDVEIRLITGRKHQIRAILENLKSPILGDVKYGGKKSNRVYLHCRQIVFNGLENNLEYLNGKKITCHINW